jgi:hypothetical protein
LATRGLNLGATMTSVILAEQLLVAVCQVYCEYARNLHAANGAFKYKTNINTY